MAKSTNTFKVTFGKSFAADSALGVVGQTFKAPANAVVAEYTKREYVESTNGKKVMVAVTHYLAVEGVKSTKTEDIVMPMLAVMLANARVKGGFTSQFSIVEVGDKPKVKTGIRTTRTAYDAFMKATELKKSDSNGNLTKALKLDDGVTLNHTPMKVTDKQALFSASGDELRSLMRITAKAIAAVATLKSDILSTANKVFNETYAETKEKSEKKTDKAA